MLNDIRWKFVAVTAILAMAVSLLSGGLSGIGFGTLILRAIIGGFVFAGLAVGLNMLIVRLFPEILEFYDESGVGDESAGEAGGDDITGSRVDIVMPAEVPGVSAAGSEESGDGAPAELEPATGDSSGISADGGESESDEASGEPMGDLDRFSSDFSDVDDEIKSSRKGDGPMADHDAEEIAQAIHTVITRDGKG